MKSNLFLFSIIINILISSGCEKPSKEAKGLVDLENKIQAISNRLSATELLLRHITFDNSSTGFIESDPLQKSDYAIKTNFNNGLWIKENWEYTTNYLSERSLEKLNDFVLKLNQEKLEEENKEIDLFSRELIPVKTAFGNLALSVNNIKNSGTNVVLELGILNLSSVNFSELTVFIRTKTKYERGERNRKIFRFSKTELKNLKAGYKKNFEITINDADVIKIDSATVSASIKSIEFHTENSQ